VNTKRLLHETSISSDLKANSPNFSEYYFYVIVFPSDRFSLLLYACRPSVSKIDNPTLQLTGVILNNVQYKHSGWVSSKQAKCFL